jgi:SAM-dependent methyltransferase
MSAQQFMRATPLVIICLTGFVQARTLYMQLKRPNSVTFPESAFCICSAILAGIHCAWYGAARLLPDSIFPVPRWRLSDETGLKADFVEGTVDQAPDLTPGPFDLVFTTWGTICWLPDVKKWAKVIASVLALGGELYFADAHPGFSVLEEYAGRLVPTYDFQTPPDRRRIYAPLFAEARSIASNSVSLKRQPSASILALA